MSMFNEVWWYYEELLLQEDFINDLFFGKTGYVYFVAVNAVTGIF